jgi:hypothetical protein
MDLFKNVERIRALLMQTCGCSEEEAIIVCEKFIDMVKRKRQQDEAQKAFNENLKQIQIANVREDRRVKGYKVSRYKKPLPPIEERKVYSRVCRRCDKIYRTLNKYSWFCDKCKLKGQPNEAPPKKE